MRQALQRPGLVGRSAELALLQEELEAATRGSGRTVVIHGDPGIGKTRLLTEFLNGARRRALVLSARAYPLGTSTPFALLSDALGEHFESPGEPSRARMLEDITSRLQALAEARPVVLALDDVHLADPSTWEAFHHLARHASEHSLLLVVALRTEELSRSPALADLVGSLVQDWLARELVLAPLDRSALWDLARRAMGREDIPATIAEGLYQKTLGNPLFTLGFLQVLAEQPGDPDPAVLNAVPDTLRRRVAARVAALPAPERAALEAVAVIGERAPPRLVAAVAGLPAADLPVLLDDLVARRLLDDETAPAGIVYDFVHPLVQEAVYETIGALSRRRLHVLAARELLAQGRTASAAVHFARGAEAGDSEALELILRAARDAEAKQSHPEAVAHLQAALGLTTDAGSRRALLDELAWQAGETGDFGVGIPALRELETLLEGSNDQVERVHLHLRLASLLSAGLGDGAQALRELEKGERIAAESGDAVLRTQALNERSWIEGIAGDMPRQIELAGAALAASRELGERGLEQNILGSLGHASIAAGDLETGAASMSGGLEIARAEHDLSQIIWFGAQVAWAWALEGRVAEALELFRSVRQEVPEAFHSHLLEFEGFTKWLAGSWEEAAADCLRISGSWSPAGMTSREVWAMGTAVMCLAGMDRPHEAAAVAARVQRRGLHDFYWMSAWYRHGLAALDRAEGRLDEAAAGFHRSAIELEAAGCFTMAPFTWLELAETAALTHDLPRLEEAVEHLDAATARLEPAWFAALRDLAVAWLAESRGSGEGPAAAEAAVASLADGPFAFFAARAFETRGRLTAGAQDLTVALSLYRQLPAPSRADGVLRRLEELGAEGRRLAGRARGAAALSARERAVAKLAARGLTAKEVAQRLFIGERTVQSHLASAYAKLGVASKRELMQRARELQLDER